MKANINNISYIADNNQFHIVTEFSSLPVESFNHEYEAREFIQGYLEGVVESTANRKGELLRNFVEVDMRSGVIYKKVNDVVSEVVAV